jgi:hypothetical protein
MRTEASYRNINTICFYLYKVPRVVKIIKREKNHGYQGLVVRRKFLFNRYRFSVLQDEKF